MGMVPGYAHDIFVSYSHVDDEPPPGQTDGWVTNLIRNLEWRLRQLCGRTDGISLWTDRDLARHVNITPHIIETLRQTATLVVVFSPAYLASAWCQRERRAFFELVSDRIDQGSRVFIVEREKVELEDRPQELADLLGHQFWESRDGRRFRTLGYPQPNPSTDFEYYAKIDDLARELHGVLARLAKGAPATAPQATRPAAPSQVTHTLHASNTLHSSRAAPSVPAAHALEEADPRTAIYLAEVTDDLDSLYDETKRYLDQHGFRVLPEVWYPRVPAEFEAAARGDLARSIVFAQLLGAFPGKKPPGSSASYVGLQHQLAAAAQTPVLQWRDPKLNVELIADPGHRALVEGESVQAIDLEEFKRLIVKRATREAEKLAASQSQSPDASSDQAFVFVNIDRGDMPLAENICGALEQHGCAYALPMHDGQPDEIRKDLEDNLLDCDGLVVVYGEITENWVREQLRQWRKMLYRREKPLRALAVYEGPPSTKHPLGMKLPNMYVLDCRNGLNLETLQPFLARLAARIKQ